MKYLNYILILLFSLGWFVGCSSHTARWLYQKGLIKDDYRYGDLYRFSNLSKFRVPVEKCEKPTAKKQTLPIKLVLFGDSFTEEGRIEKEDFMANEFERHFVAAEGYVQLAKNKKNMLIIETVERHFRERFDTRYQQVKVNEIAPKETKTWWQSLLNWHIPYSTERHESVLFSSDFILTIKEWKAALNQKVFGRIDNHVVLSKDGSEIVYSLAINPGINSIFDPLTNEEISRLVANINQTYDFYKNAGFDEVYLSIIPNKASIVAADLGTYNHLIERIEQHPSLKMPIIEMYKPLKTGGAKLFDKGDTHWNCEGKQPWIGQVNEKLARLQ